MPAAGAECWLAGALELPDIRGLLAHLPDVLVVEGFDEAALAQAGRMLRSSPRRRSPTRRPITSASPTSPAGAGRGLRLRARAQPARPLQRRGGRSAFGRGRAEGDGDVYSYDIVLDTARRLCERGHTDLVETLAEETPAELLTDRRVAEVMVRVEKLDLGPEAVGIEIRRKAAG